MLVLILIMILLSLVQSMLGVGILLFGTPTLLLMGYKMPQILALLLPAAMVISALQIKEDWKTTESIRNPIFCFMLPGVITGIVFLLMFGISFDIRIAVAAMLFFNGILRLSMSAGPMLTVLLKKHSPTFLFFSGLVHGVTNMGGALLTIFVTSTADGKREIRSKIAFGYFFMMSTQIIFLAIFSYRSLNIEAIPLAATSLLTYSLIGKRLFTQTAEVFYTKLVTGFIFMYGAILVGTLCL